MAKKKTVVDAREDSKGRINEVKLSGNKGWTDAETAMRMVGRGEIEGVHISHTKEGRPYLRTNHDGKKGNNLDEMAKDS